MTTQFTDPAPAGQFADPAPAPEKINRDRFGRYLLPHPDTGKEQAWTRVTTLADTLEDKYNVQQWEIRCVIKGMALRPDLAALAANLDVTDDKDEMNRMGRTAKETGGGSSGANLGTALHKMTEKVDAGERVIIPPAMAGEIQAYRNTLATEGVRVDPAYLERVVCVPELGVVGTLDKLLVPVAGGPYQVADLKSQKSMEFGGLKIAVQQAVYAHAYAIWNPVTQAWENPPVLDQVLATIIWLPVGRSLCELYDVDLVWGWTMAKKSLQVRSDRKVKPVTRRMPKAPVPSPGTVEHPDAAAHRALTAANAHLKPYADQYDLREAAENSLALEAAQDARTTARERLTAPTSVARPDATEDPRDLFPAIATASWEARFRAATTAEELMNLGREAMAAHGGTLPDKLKALGIKLRTELTAQAGTTP